MENQTRSELCTDDKNQIILGTLMIFLNQVKAFTKNFIQK